MKFEDWGIIIPIGTLCVVIIGITILGIVTLTHNTRIDSFCESQGYEYHKPDYRVEPGYLKCCRMFYSNHLGHEYCEIIERTKK